MKSRLSEQPRPQRRKGKNRSEWKRQQLEDKRRKPKKRRKRLAVGPSNNSSKYEDSDSRSGQKNRTNSTKSEEGDDERRGSHRGQDEGQPVSRQARQKSTMQKSLHVPAMQFDDPKKYAKYAKKQVVHRTRVPKQKQVPLFSHLPQYERESSLSLQVGFSAEELHPAFVRLGLMYAEGALTGSNARCVAMLDAFRQFITDFQHSEEEVFHLALANKIKPCIRFLLDCRPKSISMGNALRWLKVTIGKLPQLSPNASTEQAKEFLVAEIDTFVHEKINFADTVICKHGVSRINDGDVILTYAKSHVVEMTLKQAFDEGKKFRVVVVDSRPKLEGKELLRRLVKHGVKCTYVLINALSYIMNEVTKVMTGAYSLLTNGTVISRVGTALVGMIARTNNVPVLVLCETYKFNERVQLDSICFNELGDPDDLVFIDRDDARFGDVLSDWRDLAKLKLLNLTYDLVPAEFVSMVITEVGMIPSTSVPVILREYHKDQFME